MDFIIIEPIACAGRTEPIIAGKLCFFLRMQCEISPDTKPIENAPIVIT